MPYSARLLRLGSLCFCLLLCHSAAAHATLVLGRLRAEPQRPEAGQEFRLQLHLEDPLRTPIENALVFAEFRPSGQSLERDATVRLRLEEQDRLGNYSAMVRLPQADVWQLTLRDQTYPWEDAVAELELAVGTGNNDAVIDFIFPPTATGPQNLTTWLFWLLGMPVIAGIIVTVIVMNNKPPGSSAKETKKSRA